MIGRRASMFFCVYGITAVTLLQSRSFGDVHIGLIERGIIVDGTSILTHSEGDFAAQLSNSNEFGTAGARIISNVDSGRFSISGGASEYATELDGSFAVRAEVYLVTHFALTAPHAYQYNAFGSGQSDSEHWESFVQFRGPNLLWNDQWNSVGISSGQVFRSGILDPGYYELSVRSSPIVYGGADRGWAEADINIDLIISVPEPAGLSVLSVLVLSAFARSRRRFRPFSAPKPHGTPVSIQNSP